VYNQTLQQLEYKKTLLKYGCYTKEYEEKDPKIAGIFEKKHLK
jgi:hypothetical protein